LLAVLCFAASAAHAEDSKPTFGDFGIDLGGRDLTARPQDDFFAYAGGSWLDEYEIPADLPGFGMFTRLALDSEEQIRVIIEEAAKSGAKPGSNEQKVGDLFADFMDQEAIEASGLKPMADDFKRIRAAKTHEDVARLFAHFDPLGGTSPFGYYVDMDAKDPSRYLATFTQSGLGLPDRDYYLVEDNPRFQEARKVYRGYLVEMLTLAGQPEAEMRAGRIFELETHLAEAHWPQVESRDVEKTYNPMSPQELTEAAPEFPWAMFLTAASLQGEETLLINEPTAFSAMATVFADTPVEVWQDYLLYRQLRNNAAYLPKEVDDTHFRFVSAALSGATEQRDRWKRGVQFVNGAVGRAVGQLYVKRHFPPSSKAAMEELVDNLLVAMGQRIDGLDWMSEPTKAAARDKLAKFNVKIGYPDKWRDYSGLEVKRGDLMANVRRASRFNHDFQMNKLGGPVDRDEWLLGPQVVNAYYNPNLNEIVFPAAILQPPFFDPNADAAVNYGAIGGVIGHEIGHGFDDQGRKVDGDGVLRDWWQEEDAARFQEKADALVERYNGFSPIEGMFVNGRLTLGENIGDLGGTEIAYHAYHLSLDGEEDRVIDGLTGDQRFFLGWAQIWRAKYRDEIVANLVASDSHSPVEFRVNGVLPNIDAFYSAFDVQPGDGMYLAPEERVHIW
jgi:predicted metalloendopeptidase